MLHTRWALFVLIPARGRQRRLPVRLGWSRFWPVLPILFGLGVLARTPADGNNRQTGRETRAHEESLHSKAGPLVQGNEV